MKGKKIFTVKWVVSALIALTAAGCSVDVDDEMLLYGSWLEESPDENRTEFYFYKDDQVFIDRSGEKQDRTYFIEGDSIYLKRENGSTSSLYFRQINEDAFQIGNLYPEIPENQPTFMIFRRASSISDAPGLE
ncbi:hypothetical protein [Salinimicrobium sp. GXAS 041]|uniref:hypothetical protein n=1 Tax=Salinimicrobium sp. GXAS 041 TaxID=3400806 RepID=UPI003C72CA17